MFITLEGPEGSGKTTQMKRIAKWLEASGKRFVMTRQPGGTSIGGQIRKILLHPDNHDLSSSTELLLYMADRAQHLEEMIVPALDSGKVVVCDRYFDATMVYQGYARGLDKKTIRDLHRLTCRNLMPDLTLLLDVSPQVGLARAWKRIGSDAMQAQESRFEKETLAFHQRVREGYLELARKEPDRFVRIDATADEQKVGTQVENALSVHLSSSDTVGLD